ncbi:nucleotide-binding oligomerization domain-containing protein 2 [Megalops cyprinoides]|uniref:nucleotide-binding oligomerization domain-containing protein 2 n=1 Tax=Megalops cyprinoides TaxID=118141 RepID=UPI00186454AB|nr:nucleotide-binding oligomerization domain-containing protein 2 [Megalops cyprinoides]
MSAQRLVCGQREELLQALCCGGAAEGLESVLDLLLAWDVLVWEEYLGLRTLGRPLCACVRELLDLACVRGESACALLLAAISQVLPEAPKAGLSFGGYEQGLTPPLVGADPKSAAQGLMSDRPSLVRKLRGGIAAALKALLESGSFTAYDCDEVQLLLYTPSQQARRLLDLVHSKGEAAAEVLLQHIQQKEDSPTLPDNEEHPAECLLYQKKLRSTISAQSHFLGTYGGTGTQSLDEIYTEALLEVAQGSGEAQQPLGLEDILGQAGTLNEEADTVLVSGEAGSGKSTLLQRLHLLWARGAALQDFLFLFPFSCRRLSTEERELSLRELLFLHCCWPDRDQDLLFQFILDHPHRVLFTFDGMDELRLCFSDERRHCCPTQPALVPTLLFNLLQGSLMKGVRKLVTSRPEAVSPSLKRYLHKEVALKGFSADGIDCFVRKHHGDPTVAACVLDSLRANTALFGLCHIPVFCWIVSQCSRELLGCGDGRPQTITDIYLMVLQHFLQCRSPRRPAPSLCWVQDHVGTLMRLGQLALDGLESSSYVFSSIELQRCGVTEEDICTGFLIQSHNLSSPERKHYEFLHVTLQCFFAAVFIVLSNTIDQSTLAKLFRPQHRQDSILTRVCLGSCLSASSKQEGAPEGGVEEAERPNMRITATFVSGLLSQRHRHLLLQVCPAPAMDRKCRQVVRCLSKGMQKHFRSIPQPVKGEKKSMHAMPGFIWLIKCIYEMQESSIARDAVANLEVEHLKLTYLNIGPVECTALAYVLQHLRNPVGLQLDYNSVGDVGVEQLLPCLEVCHSIYLRNNNITDEGICKLIEKGVQCENFQKIALFNNKLTDACTKHFAELLKKRPDFLALRLGNNYITAAGAEHLAEGLKSCQSLQYLGLWGNKVRDRGAEALALALQSCSSLVWLSLVDNGIGSTGAHALAELIKNSNTLEELWLTKNCITREGVEYLLQALEKNTSVKSVWLKGNDLSPEEVEEFTQREKRLIF